jgi:sulfur carrier protein
MHITLNDHLQLLTAETTVTTLLQQQQLPTEGLAVAINNTVLAKRLWPEYQLQPDDNVQLFQIVTGG